MSWFDAAGFANLAKSALKEAQKTIDKALDIKDEEDMLAKQTKPRSEDNFFSSWGLENTREGGSAPELSAAVSSAPLTTGTKKLTTSISLWGSFTGSFFDNPKDSSQEGTHSHEVASRPTSFISDQPKKSAPLRSLSLDLPKCDVSDSAYACTAETLEKSQELTLEKIPPDECKSDDGTNIREEIKNFPSVEVVYRKKESRNVNNRLSVISSESDRRSTDSCEVLGSQSTPDSEFTTSMSASSSVARLRQSGSFESVEVLTSPSSVEVLGSTSSDQNKDRYSSESISPVLEGDGVEGIPELMEDEEEVSIAEDSYTSASESTNTLTAATVMDLYHTTDTVKDLMFKSTSSLETSFTESPREPGPGVSGRASVNLVLAHSSHSQVPVSNVMDSSLAFESVKASDSMASIRVLEGNGSNISKSDFQETLVKNVQETDSGAKKMSDSGSQMGDSECEAQGMSSCEEGTIMGSSGEETTLHVGETSSSYLKNMLADAMSEQSPPPREHSPISSESRSDLVKVGSSGHTSGDELETTTSSDIEIISSPTPNGDSSSTTSRQSPAKLLYRSNKGKMALVVGPDILIPEVLGKVIVGKVKGHQREPSETSSGGSDDSSEVDKLLKKISEMTEILQVREAKLIDLSRINADLQETNCDLKHQLECQQQKQDVNQMSEEFNQRLAALERKFQQAIREKEILRKQLENMKAAAVTAEQEAEKDQIIAELRAEGEKLSKQQLALNNVIKKLRTTEKEQQRTIASLKEQVEECSLEVERSKKALSAKEDVERSQIEAVHQLTRSNQRLESQIANLQSQVDNLTSTLVSSQKELSESKSNYAALESKLSTVMSTTESEVRAKLEAEWEAAAEQRDDLEEAVHDLREKLTLVEEQHLKQEALLRQENAELLRRLEASEMRAEELSQSVTMATKPLVRQLEVLTANSNAAAASWEKQEKKLTQTINEFQSRISSLTDSERSAREQLVTLSTRSSAVEAKLSAANQEVEGLILQVKELFAERKQLQQEKEQLIQEHEKGVLLLKQEMSEMKRQLTALEQQLAVERAALEAEKRRNLSLQEQAKVSRGVTPPSTSPRSSPTLSFGHASVTESVTSSAWPNFGDDMFETASCTGRLSNVYDSLRPGNTTTLIEGLQAQLKMRDGEVHQLQWELSHRDMERATLSNELSELTTKVEVQERQLAALSELQTKYDALLQMYGEKLEESQELRMDLQDIKDMYKSQIDQLLKKEPGVSS